MRKMKNSGVAWIGDIPENWKVLRNKNLIYEINEKCTDTTDLPLLSVSEYYGVAPRADKIHDGQIVSRAETFEGYKICHQDDVVMNIMLAWKRAQAVSSFNGIVSPAYCVYRKKNNSKLDMTFFNYLIRSDLYISVFKRFSTGIIDSRLRLYPEKFLALHSHVPPTYEQHKIAKHLNKACNNIENLINNQEQQIEKLKQYKQSLITEVVTKGLNPDVQMKDSGIEWIGIISAIHNIYRLKYLLNSQMLYGANEAGSFYTNNAVRYIRITDITEDNKLKDSAENLYLSIEKAKPYILKDKDVLFARSGATVGKAFMYLNEYGKSAFAGYLIKAECNTQKLLPEYLFYYTQSSLYEYWKNMIFIQATIQNIGANKYSNMPIIQMSLDEQNQIVKFLDDKCAKIDRLIAIKQEKINKLNDYKKSLIYEYVTGKKEA